MARDRPAIHQGARLRGEALPHKPAWGNDWRRHFSVDIVNGTPGNELKCDNRVLVTTRLRVGFESDGLWRTFGLRKDFNPAAAKVQEEDDITAFRAGAPAPLVKKFVRHRQFAHDQVRSELRRAFVPAGLMTPSTVVTTNNGSRFRTAR